MASNTRIFAAPLTLSCPGVFVTGTDTGVGKTVVTCGIGRQLHSVGLRVGVSKPMATGCRRDREGLVNEDAEAIAHFSDCRFPLDVINPVRYAPPLAPAVAAKQSGEAVDFELIANGLERLDEGSDVMVIEGVGGLLVPIDGNRPRVTVLDLARELRYPVVVVARAGLGTLSHTAMTVRLLRENGCTVAGIVINGYDADAAASDDVSMRTNREWLEKMNRVTTLATVPQAEEKFVAPHEGRIPGAVLDAVAQTDWRDIVRHQSPSS